MGNAVAIMDAIQLSPDDRPWTIDCLLIVIDAIRREQEDARKNQQKGAR